MHIYDFGRVGLEFQPSAAVGYYGRAVQCLTGRVFCHVEIRSRRPYQLTNDDSLSPVDDESACFGHQREISHEDFLLLDLAGIVVDQPHLHLERSRVRHIPLFALVLCVLGRPERVSGELEGKVSREILHR